MEQTFGSGQKMTENTEKKKTFFDFVKEHKKEIAIAGIVGVGVGVGMVIFKNRTAINALNIEEVVAKGLKTNGDAISVRSGVVEACHAWNPPSIKPINVSEHLRNLPDGWKASQSKIDLAARYGFSLGDHQTWVDSYAKTAA
jgi:hypothetical protein